MNNAYCIAQYQSLLLPFYEEKLPQFIDKVEIILAALKYLSFFEDENELM